MANDTYNTCSLRIFIAIANKQSIRFRLKSGLLLPNKKNVLKGLCDQLPTDFCSGPSVINLFLFKRWNWLFRIRIYCITHHFLKRFGKPELKTTISTVLSSRAALSWFRTIILLNGSILIYGLFGTNPTLSYPYNRSAFAIVVSAGFMAIARKLNPNAKSYQILLIGISGVLVQTYFPIDLLIQPIINMPDCCYTQWSTACIINHSPFICDFNDRIPI